MNLFELINGTKYRRTSWNKNKYIQQEGQYFTCFNHENASYPTRETWCPYVRDLQAKDWEIVE